MPETLLVIEDEALLGTEVSRHFKKGGWEVVLADTLARARRELLERSLDPLVVLADMNLPDGNALDLLEQVRAVNAQGEWIFITAYGSVPDSVRALRLGAIDFLEKPCEIARLDLVVAGAARSARAQRRIIEIAEAKTRAFSPDSFVGRSQAASDVRQMLRKLGTVPFSTLLITGETGAGKGLAARILHHSGLRAEGPLVELNCAAMPRDLVESELFGHEAGAFTGAKGRRRGLMEQADGGALFLDEIGELEIHLQAKLLKAIEERSFRRVGGEREIKVDAQIIAASNSDLLAMIDRGAFRSDLYHRLSAFQLALPPPRGREGRTWRIWSPSSSPSSTRWPARTSARSRSRPGRPCGGTTGPATCASCATWWSAASCSRSARSSTSAGPSSPQTRRGATPPAPSWTAIASASPSTGAWPSTTWIASSSRRPSSAATTTSPPRRGRWAPPARPCATASTSTA